VTLLLCVNHRNKLDELSENEEFVLFCVCAGGRDRA